MKILPMKWAIATYGLLGAHLANGLPQLAQGAFIQEGSLSGQSPCLSGTYLAMPASESQLRSNYRLNEHRDLNRFSSGASVRGSLGPFSVGGKLSLATALVNHDLKSTSMIHFDYQAGSLLLTQPKLNPIGLATMTQNPWQRFRRCGDGYIQQMTLGGRLTLGLEFSFLSKEIKNQFDLKVRGEAKFGFVKVKITILNLRKDFDLANIRGTVRIIFAQEGGNQAAFLAMRDEIEKKFGQCFVQGHQEESGHGAKEGFMTGYEGCLKGYQSLLQNYAQVQFPKQFAPLKQVAQQGLKGSGLIPLHTVIKSYRQAGFFDFMELRRDLPPNMQAFLQQEVPAFNRNLIAFANRINIIQSIVDHKSPNETIEKLKEHLATRTVPQQNLIDYHKAIVTRDQAVDALAVCRSRLSQLLRQEKPRESQQAIQDCRSSFVELAKLMDQYQWEN